MQLHREYVHRMLSVLIFVKARVPLCIWFVSISLDAISGNRLNINELNIVHFIYLNYDYCVLCQRRNNLQHVNVPTDYHNQEGMAYCVGYIKSVINYLKLTKDSEVNELFIYENSSNMYEFVWDEHHDYRKIIPQRRLFPFYNDSIVEQSYVAVKNSWSKNYFIILTYADAIKQNALLVVYYSIVRHLYYVKKMWFIIFAWHTCFDSDSENCRILIEIRANFLAMPLSTFKEMVCYIAHEHFCHVKDIIAFLSSYRNVTKERLDAMLTSTLRQYNYYGKMYGLEAELVESSLRQVVEIPKTCNLETIQEDLRKICNDMDEYFKELKDATSPLYWPIIQMFSTSKRKIPCW
ncbi:uncharacterized protein LOC126843193 [Adelges cooleyi]|uniref:uncharacterized protein LOC126843193 n=1 Tax=Adelges cooleyi TaxID=133065 RepID=UPI0021805CF2|nr:uncharacterized protein LOC126843193 [Adelges cooleyi]